MYTRKRQVPRHRGDQIIGGVAAKGLFGAGKALFGQLTDGQKGVNMGEVLKGGAAGAASAIPGVGGIAAKAINNIGGGAQATPATPGQVPAVPGQVPAVPGQVPAVPGQVPQFQGGSIPYDPELAGAPYSMRGVKLMKSGGTIDYDNGGKSGEVPGFDMTTRKTMSSFDVEGQKPVMEDARQIYIDGLPTSAKQAKALMDERAEGMEGQVSSSLGEAMMSAEARRNRERSGRELLGPGLYRPRATEELKSAQKRQGVSGLLGALEGYDTSRGTKAFGKGGYLR